MYFSQFNFEISQVMIKLFFQSFHGPFLGDEPNVNYMQNCELVTVSVPKIPCPAKSWTTKDLTFCHAFQKYPCQPSAINLDPVDREQM